MGELLWDTPQHGTAVTREPAPGEGLGTQGHGDMG